jgi:hypothetical protein
MKLNQLEVYMYVVNQVQAYLCHPLTSTTLEQTAWIPANHRLSRPSKIAKRNDLKTYNSGDSPVVTHLTTSPPVRCLNRAERTGSLVFNVLWSYVEEMVSL